jgi:hypothetical protein
LLFKGQRDFDPVKQLLTGNGSPEPVPPACHCTAQALERTRLSPGTRDPLPEGVWIVDYGPLYPVGREPCAVCAPFTREVKLKVPQDAFLATLRALRELAATNRVQFYLDGDEEAPVSNRNVWLTTSPFPDPVPWKHRADPVVLGALRTATSSRACPSPPATSTTHDTPV